MPAYEVYTYVLDCAHSVFVNGTECVTLGHGIDEDVVRHVYFGSQQVIGDLKCFPGWLSGYITLTEASFVRARGRNDVCALRVACVQLPAHRTVANAASEICTDAIM
jgi:hypothetical protein